MSIMTTQRVSVTWPVTGELTPAARETLAQVLGCVFTDENAPRPHVPLTGDVDLLVSPRGEGCVVIAHFDDVTEPPETQVQWLQSWVHRAVVAAGLGLAGGARPVVTGL